MIRFLLLIAILLLPGPGTNAQAAVPPALGDGSSGNPYQVTSLRNLNWIADGNALVAGPSLAARNSAQYIQTAHIDASETSGWITSDRIPADNSAVSCNDYPFSVILDDQGHTTGNTPTGSEIFHYTVNTPGVPASSSEAIIPMIIPENPACPGASVALFSFYDDPLSFPETYPQYPEWAVGPPDDNNATLNYQGEFVAVDLGCIRPANSTVTIKWQGQTVYGISPVMLIQGSADGTTWDTGTTYNETTGQTVYRQFVLVADTRYLKITLTNSSVMFMDAAYYNCPDCDGLEPPYLATNLGAHCLGSTLELSAEPFAVVPEGVQYYWTGPNGFTSSLRNPVISSVTPANSGIYAVRKTYNGCTSIAYTRNITVYDTKAPVAGNNGPVCEGSAIVLTATSVEGATYHWTGPGGFSSNQQNPMVSNKATMDMAGIYTVVATANYCTSPPASTTVNIVTSLPCPNASVALQSFYDDPLSFPETYPQYPEWAVGPPDDNNATLNYQGEFVAVDLGCIRPANSTVTIKWQGQTVYGISPVMLIQGSADGTSWDTGSTYNETSGQNVYRQFVLGADTRYLKITLTNSSVVFIDAVYYNCQDCDWLEPPYPASNLGVHCTGSTLELFADPFKDVPPGVEFSWTGPAGFTSSLRNPVINSLTTANSGIYSVKKTYNGCTSIAYTRKITVYETQAPVARNNGPVCEGSPIMLTATSVEGATYHWTGPAGFSSNQQNPVVTNSATPEMAGVYTVVAHAGYCNSVPAGTTVVISSPSASISGNATACTSTTLTALTDASGPAFAWFKDDVPIPGETNSTLNVTQSGVYQVKVTCSITGCEKLSEDFAVTISPLPEITVIRNNSPICYAKDAEFYLEGTPGAEVTYSFDGGITTSTQSLNGGTATIIYIKPESDVILTLISVKTGLPGCSKALNSTSAVYVNNPSAGISGVSQACGSTTLTAVTNAPSPVFAWFRDDVLIPGETNASLEVTQSGDYKVKVTMGGTGCEKLSGAFHVTINLIPDAVISDNNSPICSYDYAEFHLEGTPGAEVTYSFDGGINTFTRILTGGTATIIDGEASGDVTLTLISIKMNSTGCTKSLNLSSKVTVNTLPLVRISGEQLACTSTTLTAVTDASSPKYQWGRIEEENTVLIGEGSALEVTQSGSYMLAVEDGLTGCWDVSEIFKVTITPLPEDKPVSAEETPVCSGSSTQVILHSSQPGVVYQLRNDAGDVNIGDPLTGNGNDLNFATGPLNAATTFQVLASLEGCSAEMTTKVTVTISDVTPPSITSVTASPPAICNGSSTTLTVTGTPGGATEWKWYSGSCGGTPAGTGVTLTVTPNVTTTYYVRGEGSCITPGDCVPVTVLVEATPVAAVLTRNPDVNQICETTSVRVIYTPGSGGNGTDHFRYRTVSITGVWSNWQPFDPESSISGFGKGFIQIETRRLADYCYDSDVNTVGWFVDEREPVAGTLTRTPDASPVCEGTGVSAILTPGSGGIYDELEYQTKTGPTWSGWSPYVSGTVVPTTGLSGVEIRTRRMGGFCTPSAYTTVAWTIESPPGGGTLTGDQTICPGSTPADLTLTGQEGTILKYQKSDDAGFTSTVDIESTASILPGEDIGPLSSTAYFRAVVQNGTCPVAYSNVVIITAGDIQAPSISCPQEKYIITLNAECTAKLPDYRTMANKSDNCGTVMVSQSPEPGTPVSGTGNLTVTLTADDGNGNTADCSFTVFKVDNIPPTISCPPTQTLVLNASCSGTLPDYRSKANTSDNCAVPAVSQSPEPGTPVSGVGNLTVTLTANDGNGNNATGNFTVTKVDNTPPTALCRNITVYLDPTGHASITADQVDSGSSDNCGIYQMTVTPAGFTCENTGDNTVTLTVFDASGNSSSCQAHVLVIDHTPPVALCKNITVQLSNVGSASISAADIDGGSTDACGIGTRVASITSFNCGNTGNNAVILTVTDVNGNKASCTATVTVVERQTTVENLGAFSGQYTDPVTLTARLSDNLTGPLGGFNIKFTIGNQTATGRTGADGIAQVSITLNQDPGGTYKVKAEFAGSCPFIGSSDEDEFDLLQENACGSYTGTVYANTAGPTVLSTTITLSAVVSQQGDGYEIPFNPPSNLTFSFKPEADQNGKVSPLGSPEFNPVTSTFTQVAEVIVNTGSIFTSLDVSWTIGGGFTNAGCSDQRWIVTVALPSTDFAAGGGQIILGGNSGGTLKGLAGTRNNFGFGIKWGRNYSKLTGNFNTIWRQADKSFQARSNTASALVITKLGTNQYMAQITYSNVNMRQLDCLTNCWSDGNGTAILTVYDYCEGGNCTPANSDKIGIAIRNKTGVLIYSSNTFDPATRDKTVVQNLAGGNIQVKPAGSSVKSAEIQTVTQMDDHPLLKVYPNPFSENVQFEFSTPVSANTRIDLYDLTGRLVKTIFNQMAEEGITYKTEFKPGSVVSAMYVYRMTLGEQVINGKVLFKK